MEKQFRNKMLLGFFIVGLLLIALLVFSNPILSSPIKQAEASGELIYTFDSVKNTYSLTGYTGSPTDIVVPATYDDGINGSYPVTTIGVEAFQYCSSLNSVIISDGITLIGNRAFARCNNLKSIVIPGSVVTIGTSAISYCSTLTSLTLGEGIENISGSAFYACLILPEVIFPSTLKSIGNSAFLGCRKLTSVTIPSGVTNIEGGVFGNCRALEEIILEEPNEYYTIQDGMLYNKDLTTLVQCPPGMSISSYVVPETVTFIETRAFLGAKITSIAIPSTITNLPTQALRQCSNLESVTFGENSQLTVLGNYNFEGSKSLPSIKIPDGVQILQNYTFGNCSILEYVIFSPDSQLKTVMRDCFYRCTSLKELTLPVGVTSIGANAFGDSTSFASLILKNATPCSIASDALKNTLIATADGKIYVPNASVEAYKGADVWSNYSTQIYRNPLEFVTFENTRDAKFFGGMTFTHDVPNHQITLSDLEGINCTFLGWMGPGYDVPTKSIVIPDNIDEADARTYTACWDIHNVTYELDGGTNHVNNKPIYSESNLPQTLYNPTKEGYTFAGWYDNLDFNGDVIIEIPVGSISDKTYYAKWTANINTPYAIEYYKQNLENYEYTLVETDDTRTGTTGQTVSIVNYENKYTGFTCSEINSVISGVVAADGSLVLKAYYNRNKYIVTFVDFDNTQIGELQEVKHGGNAVAPQEPSREGYEFLSWDTSFVNVTQVLKVKATYIANQYTITFNTNCDAVVSSITKGYETAIEKPENPKRTGYTFVNWYTDNDEFTKLFVFNTMPLNGATLYAKWDANTDTPYAIEYYQEKIASDEYELYDTDNTLFGTTDSEITLTGYENKYTGFTYSETNSMISGTIAADGSLTLKVYYNRNICTATFTNGNTAYDVQVLKYGGSILIPTTNPTKEANAKYTYKFNGWDPSVPETISTTIEFVAQYIEVINKYTVTFKDFDGRVLKTQMVEYSSSATAPVNPTRENYAFIGWDVNFSNITADLIVTATYSVSTYQINYVLNGGENHIANPSSYTIGASAVVLKDPSKVGYNFLGWYDNINFAGEVVQTISSNMGSINLYAKWKKIVFDITFRKNGHITVVTVGYGDKITKPNNPEKTNCAFEGWYADIALTEKFDFDKVYNANKTIYAKWTCNLDVKLVIDDNPGEIKENTIVGREVDTLSSLIEKYKDAKTGYTLINLSYKNLDTAEINEITETTVFDYDSRFEIIANYEANQYKVFLYPDNGATDPPPITVSYDEEILFLASPKREGYKFLGWYDNASDMFVQNGDIYASPNNTSLIAKWEKETSDFPWLYAGVGFGLGAVLTAIILLAAFYILVKKNNAQAKAITSKIENLEKQVEKDKE